MSYLEPHQQNEHNVIEGPKGSKEKFIKYNIPGDLINLNGDWREYYFDYLGCCSSIDFNLGKVLSTLKILKMEQNMLIFFSRDHGCHFRTRNSEYKRSCHEASIRIPLVIKGPDFSGGKIIKSLVSIIDLPPTLLMSAGIKVPKFMKGNPLQFLLDNKYS